MKSDFSRQSFLGEQSATVLANTRVVIVGCGGGGSHIAQQLAHLGVGKFVLIDSDDIEDSNLNRLVTGTQADVVAATPKVEIIARAIRAIRPWADVTVVYDVWQKADEHLVDAHFIFGCIDGYYARSQLERAARRFLVSYIDIGMDVKKIENGYAMAGQVIVSAPASPCMTCMGFLSAEKLAREEDRYGDAGINPQVVWANGVLASLAVGTFVQCLMPWNNKISPSPWIEFEGNGQTVHSSRQPAYNVKGPCPHFGGEEDLGDPFFSLCDQIEALNIR